MEKPSSGVSTSEGGMVLTNNNPLAAHIRQLKGQGQDPNRRYWFPLVGYNYRMTNIQAALGLAGNRCDIDPVGNAAHPV